jgi:hypothetical protein
MNKPIQIFLSVLLVGFACFGSWVSIRRYSPVFMLGVLFPFVVIWLSSRKDVLLLGTFYLLNSSLTLYFLPSDLNLYHLFASGFIAIAFVDICLRRGNEPNHSLNKYVYSLIGVVLLVMVVRGSGFRVLGDSMWGGFRYVNMLVSLLFLTRVSSVRLYQNQVVHAVYYMMGLSLLPALAELLFVISGSKLYFLYYILKLRGSTVDSMFYSLDSFELVRFHSASIAGGRFVVLGVLVYVSSKSRRLLGAFVFTVGILMIAISGHRGVFITSVLFFWFCGFLFLKIRPPIYILSSFGLALIGIVFVYIIAPYLPYSAQRVISFLPGVRISDVVRVSAESTLDWRFDVWREAMVGWKDDIFIGRGFTFPGKELELLNVTPGEYGYWWAVISKVYHNGILSLFLCLGFPGFFFTCVVIGVFLHRHIKIYKDCRLSDLYICKLHGVIIVYVISMSIYYFFIYGDAYTSLPNIFYILSFLELLVASKGIYMSKLNHLNKEYN